MQKKLTQIQTPPNLNTIYEEFDFESKIKELKDKNIKIRRIVKNKAQIEQQEQQKLDIVEIKPTNKIIKILPTMNKPQKQQSHMYHSQIFPNPGETLTEKYQEQQKLQEGQIPLQKAIIFEESLEQKKNKGRMFQSTMEGKKPTIFQEIDQLLLPQHVSKQVLNSQQNLKRIQENIEQEKQKLQLEMNEYVKCVQNELELQKQKIFLYFENYIHNFQANQQNIQYKIKQYKQNAFNYQLQDSSNEHVVQVSRMDIMGRKIESNNLEKIGAITKGFQIIDPNQEKINNESSKILIEYQSDLLDKQLTHYPTFGGTQFSQQMLQHNKQQFYEIVHNFFMQKDNEFEKFLYKIPQYDFATIWGQTFINPSIYQKGQIILGEFKSLKSFKVKSLKQQLLQVKQENLCMTAFSTSQFNSKDSMIFAYYNNTLNESTIIIQDLESNRILYCYDSLHSQIQNILPIQIKLFELEFEQQNDCQKSDKYGIKNLLLNQKNEPPQTLLCLTVYNKLILLNIVKSQIIYQYEFDSNIILVENLNDMQNIVVNLESNHFIIFNILANKILKCISDKGNISSICKRKDNLFTAGFDCKIKIWDCSSQFVVQRQRKVIHNLNFLSEICDNCPILFVICSQLDLNRLFSGGEDGKIKIWNIQSKLCQQIITGHSSQITQLLIIENPIDHNANKNYLILSKAKSESFFKLSSSYSSLCSDLYFIEKPTFSASNLNINDKILAVFAFDYQLKSNKNISLYFSSSNQTQIPIIYKLNIE